MIDRSSVAAPERDERAELAALSDRAIHALCEAEAVLRSIELPLRGDVDAHTLQRIARNMRAAIGVIARAFAEKGVSISARPDQLNIERLTMSGARVLRNVTLHQLDEALGTIRAGSNLAVVDEFQLYGMRSAAMGAYRLLSWIEKASICAPPVTGEIEATAFQEAVQDIRDDTGRGLHGVVQLRGEKTPPRGMPVVQVLTAPPTVRMTREELRAAGLVSDDKAMASGDRELESDDAIDRALAQSFSRMDAARMNPLGRER